MSRETKTFTTPAGKTAVLHTYLTGREMQELKGIISSALSVNMDEAATGRASMGDLPGSFLVEQEKKALQYILVSYDTVDQNPVNALLDQPATEYEAVIKEINAIQNPTRPTN